MGYKYEKLKEIIFILMSDGDLNENIYFAGGLVPWIISDKNSKREHGDIDIVVEEKNMAKLRKYIIDKGFYKEEKDSKNLRTNREMFDFGLEIEINEVKVNISPFAVKEDYMVQKNFTLSQDNEGVLLKVTLKGIDSDKFFKKTKLKNGFVFNSYSLETVKAAKLVSDRPKDKIDIIQIDKIGVDEKICSQLTQAFNNMEFEIINGDSYEKYILDNS